MAHIGSGFGVYAAKFLRGGARATYVEMKASIAHQHK